ncbi:MAG: hypothetical protein QM619_06070 [Micropruina sp.]|uniref:hypothetical protein n=1 Tax=Micropruina sp. TaxID=2737536 RepID=UPI0039E5AC09
MSRSGKGWVALSGRFAWVVAGVALASVVWLVGVLAFSLSPEQAAQRRAAPELPPRTVVVREVALRQVAWFPCVRRGVTVNVVVPQVPKGSRSVVTGLPMTSSAVRTGTELARVAAVPLIAVVTDAVFYRDLRVGDRGADVRGFERALKRAGIIATADGVLDAATVRAWRRLDSTSPVDRIRLRTLVAVPSGATLGARKAEVGEVVKPGTVLLEVTAGAEQFRCMVPNAGSEVTPANTTFMVARAPVKVASVIVRPRTADESGYVLVTPKEPVKENQAQLGVQSGGSDKPVLAVPVSAVRVDAGGRPMVVIVAGQTQREVPVTVGTTAQGLVAITGDGIGVGVQVRLFDPSDQPTPSPGATGAPSPQQSQPSPR